MVKGLLLLGKTIPIIREFAEVLQSALEVIEQASLNEKAIVRLHNHAVGISDELFTNLSGLSEIRGLDNALKRLMKLLNDISSYIVNHERMFTKVMSATDTNLVEQVNIYIENLSDHKEHLIFLIGIDTNRKVNDIAEANKVSKEQAVRNNRKAISDNLKVKNKHKKVYPQT